MAIPDGRMSTTFVDAVYVSPDELHRALTTDYERGPVALNDSSEGVNYQKWTLTYDLGSGDFTVTPELVGAPVVGVINAANVTQCSFCFDQNGHVNIAYTVAYAQAYLYWYDSDLPAWTQDALDADVVSPHLTLDDKRATQTSANDILLWYTRETAPDKFDLFHRLQRERFATEHLMAESFEPYILKCGMHKGNRVKITGSRSPL